MARFTISLTDQPNLTLEIMKLDHGNQGTS